VTVRVNDATKVYGNEDPALTSTTEGLAGSDYLVTTLSREEGNDVGTYTIGATVETNPNCTISIVTGTLTIEPREITVVAEEKIEQEGEEEKTEPTVTVEGLPEGETPDVIEYTVERREAEEDGEPDVIQPTGEEEQGNYIVHYQDAQVVTVPAETVIVRIIGNSGSFMYDGTEKDLSGYTVEISNPAYSENDFSFLGSSELKGTNAGTYRTNMTAADFRNLNPDFDVVFEVVNGTLEIAKRKVTLTSADDTRPYDGTALSNTGVTVTGDGFVAGEEPTIVTTGRISRVGSAQNTFSVTFPEGVDPNNYDITTIFGTLTLTEVAAHRLTVTYVDENGEEIGSFEKNYPVGETYEVISARKTGYKPDTEKVTGVMGNEDVSYTVRYEPVLYSLTVEFVPIGADEQVREPLVYTMKSGTPYTIELEDIPGYKPMLERVEGIQPAGNRTVTVLVVPEDQADTQIRQYSSVTIDDYGTPLGVTNNILGSGEIIE